MNIENQQREAPTSNTIAELQYVELINATSIMELAIERNAFSVSELVKIAPVVEKFQNFCKILKEEQEKNAVNQINENESKE